MSARSSMLSLEGSLHASSVQPPHKLKESLTYIISFYQTNQWINESMGRYEWTPASVGIDSAHTRVDTHQIFTIDKWVTLSVTLEPFSRGNDFMSEKICCWIQRGLAVRNLDGFCSLVQGWAINLKLTSYWSGNLRGAAFIRWNGSGDAGGGALFWVVVNLMAL